MGAGLGPTLYHQSTFLCPEFVVPEGMECTVMIPPLPLSGTKVEGECTIDDTWKSPVFIASFKHEFESHGRGGRIHDMHCVLLESNTFASICARCGPGFEDMVGQQMELQILSTTGEFRGIIQRSRASGSFSVLLHSPTLTGKLATHFDDLSQSPTHAYNEDGKLLAILEIREGDGKIKTRSMRIASLCDASLLITTVLCALLLEHKQEQQK